MTKLTSYDLKTAIRRKYVRPGGYLIFGITTDGALLCPDCMRLEYRLIAYSRLHQLHDGWNVTALDTSASLETLDYIETHPEDLSPDYCAHCDEVLNP